MEKGKHTVNSMRWDTRGELNFCDENAVCRVQPLIVFRMARFRQSRRGTARRNVMRHGTAPGRLASRPASLSTRLPACLLACCVRFSADKNNRQESRKVLNRFLQGESERVSQPTYLRSRLRFRWAAPRRTVASSEGCGTRVHAPTRRIAYS